MNKEVVYMVNVGEKAPKIEVKDTNGNPVQLSSFKGKKVLLAFFPFAFSPVCTDEMSCFQNDLQQFASKNTAVLAVSVDSHWSNKAFADKLGVNFPLLADFSKDAAKKFGVLRAEGFSERAYFVIDEQGIIRFKQVMDSPGKKLDNKELLKALGK